ncbi:MAG: DUF1007 family protein [Pseudomonadota bacterium]
MKRAISFIVCLLAAPVSAHPHIFVDTGLDLKFDAQGRLTEVTVTWAYDDFYSLLITEDRGLDQDYDGEMTDAEIAQLTGFDMQWIEGFNGDLVIMAGGEELALSGPQSPTATYSAGRITTTHVRQVLSPMQEAAALEVKPYDRTYYTAYDISLPVRVVGYSICQHWLEVPDLDTALLGVQDALLAMDTMAMTPDDALPDIGIGLASTVHVSCASS